ncbi:EAL domain-containing protein [Deinococcus ruber]|uniref:Uncharacterized protein n=1 Tax=Deinococcus ruber TaxID=1848197 RepID=A0A918C279_9DEIO|nr:EAL domain-containing protein [Deinococcus ruber]GGR03208.1 hypothetical protein GCM10008957_15090 [Deinococcus ruber]
MTIAPTDPYELLKKAESVVSATPTEAMALTQQVLRATPVGSLPGVRARAQLLLAEALWRTGDLSAAETVLQEARPYIAYIGTGAKSRTAQYAYITAQIRRSQNRIEEALTAFNQAVNSAEQDGQYSLQATAHNQMAQMQHQKGDSAAALRNLDRAISLRHQLQDLAGELRLICNKGIILVEQGHTADALKQLAQAQEKLEQGQLPLSSELHFRSTLGMLMEQLGHLEEAGRHYLRGRELAIQSGDVTAQLTLAVNSGEVHRQLGALHLAVPLLEEALRGAQEIKDTRIESAALQSLGTITSLQGNYTLAQQYFEEAEALAVHRTDVAGEIEALLGQGRNDLAEHHHARAQLRAERALHLAQESNRLQHVVTAHLLLAEVHEQHDPRASIQHLQAVRQAEQDLRAAAFAEQARHLAARADLESAHRQTEHERQLRNASDTARAAAESALQTQLEALERHRLHDPLCGLPNRLLLNVLLGNAMRQTQRHPHALAVAILDLDQFKQVNDAFGYAIGDELLKEVARRVMQDIGERDILARTDGDEFVLILCEEVDHSIEERLQRILMHIQEEFTSNGQDLIVAASIGVAFYPDHGLTSDDLQRAAHTALTQAKYLHSGVEIYHGGQVERQEALQVETALAKALQRQEFQVYYQPLIDAHSGRAVKIEALLRWKNPTLGMRSPAEFIPILERSGGIVPVGQWVLNEACRAAATHPDLRVAVNLSARQFSQGDLPGTVRQALQASGLPPHRLDLEITESLMMQSPERAATVMGRLKETGARVILDDFGTGYSSLSYLARFPLDGLKIDRSFVNALSETSGQAIIRAIVQLGSTLGLEVVAEGVETPEQHALLKQLGVPLLQGYLFGRPQPQLPDTPG